MTLQTVVDYIHWQSDAIGVNLLESDFHRASCTPCRAALPVHLLDTTVQSLNFLQATPLGTSLVLQDLKADPQTLQCQRFNQVYYRTCCSRLLLAAHCVSSLKALQKFHLKCFKEPSTL